VLAGLFIVPVLLYSILLLPVVQTSLVKYVTNEISQDLDTEISIGRVHLRPFKTLVIDDVVVFDQQKDTLIAIEQIAANIDSVFLNRKQIYLQSLSFRQPSINVYEQDSIYNFDFLKKAIATSDSIKSDSKWYVGLTNANIENGKMLYDAKKAESISFSDFNLVIDDILHRDSLWQFDIRQISLKSRKWIKLENIQASVVFNQSNLYLTQGLLKTQFSSLELDSLRLALDVDKKGLDRIQSFYVDVRRSRINSKDLTRVTAIKKATSVGLSGVLYGTVDDIRGRKVKLDFGPHSQLSSSFDISGLPNLDETFLYLDVRHLHTTPEDIEQLFSHARGQALKLPAALKNLEEVNYKGNFTGYLSDLVAYGEFSTSLGTISTDIGFEMDERDNLVFSGNLSTTNFDIGQLAGAEDHIGDVSMSVDIRGSRQSEKKFNAFLSGLVDTLRVNEYAYTNIKLNGLFENDRFDGDFLIDDPNGQLGFNGKIDLSGEVPNFKFAAHLTDIRLDKLNLYSKAPNSSLTADIQTDISGKDVDDIVGFLNIKDLSFKSDDKQVSVDSLLLLSVRENQEKRIVLQSDIAEGDLVGVYNFTHLGNILKKKLLHHLPSLSAVLKVKDVDVKANDFNFSCNFKKISGIADMLMPGMEVSDNGLVLGSYNTEDGEVDFEVELEFLNYKGVQVQKPEIHITSHANDKLMMVSRANDLQVNNLGGFQNLSFHHTASNDTLQFNVFWNNWDEYTNSGSIITKTVLKNRDNAIYSSTELSPSYVMVRDSLWEIQPTTIHYHPDGFSLKHFRVHHANQEIGINGFAHREIKDGIKVHFQNISLSDMIGYKDLNRVEVSGALNGTVEVENLYKEPVFSGNLGINNFVFNKDLLGDLAIDAEYEPQAHQVKVSTSIEKDGKQPLNGGGVIDVANKQVYLSYDIDELEIGFLNLYLKRIMQNLSGTASGQLAVVGPLSKPELLGRLNINKAFFDVGLLQTTYSMTDSVIFDPNLITFKNIKLSDRNGRQGTFDGTIRHETFRNMHYNLSLLVNNMLVMDTKYIDNPLYYGEVYADGNMSVTGTTTDLIIDIAGQTRENTQFYIPLEDEESAEESNFIRFINTKEQSDDSPQKLALTNSEYEIDLTGMTVSMDLDITPEARCQVIFDSTVGDILRGQGNGNLQIRMDKAGGINFYGDYNFDEGDYMFTLRNVLNKKFVINQGSSINWDGNPYDANIDLNATYRLKTSLSDLAEYSNDDRYIRRIPVHCNMLLTDRLTKPNIKFEIKTPSDQDNNQNLIDRVISTEEEINRQVLSLLVLNRFYSEAPADQNNNSPVGNNAALVTTTEMLSNQLSHWLSQISSDVDIGVSYRPASELTDDEVEVALSTQIFNNRVIVNGNVGYGQDQTRPSNLIGDFDVEVKLNKSGSLRAKAYTKSNNDVTYSTTSPTTQGVGVSFKEEFDTLEELMHKYWLMITGKKKKEKKEEEQQQTKD
jgi:hypothetical protein